MSLRLPGSKAATVVRRFFPSRPVMGIVLCAILALEGVALADTLITTDKHAVEGVWKTADPPFTVDGNNKQCKYTRTADKCEGLPDVQFHLFPTSGVYSSSGCEARSAQRLL